MKKFAVILAGCGVYDGAEIHEATLSLYAIMKEGASYQCFAPDIPQHHVVNHLDGKEMAESRNVLVESARIARGKILPLSSFHIGDWDAVLFPGGYGVAKNLCNYAFMGAACQVIPEVEKVILDTISAGKPLGALCVAPSMLARTVEGVHITLGSDPADADNTRAMGAVHVNTTHGQVVKDPSRKIFSTPCYMLDASILDIAAGAENIVRAMIKEME